MDKALALALGLTAPALAATPTSLTVWLPEQGQTATLSNRGLVAADGGRIILITETYKLPLEQPLPGGSARLYFGINHPKTRLEVVRGGKVTATRLWPAERAPYALWGTQRGPCVSDTDQQGKSPMLHCFSTDLKTEWAKFPGSPFINTGGRVAYTVQTDWEGKNPYSEAIGVTRRDLQTGRETLLSYRVPLTQENAEYHRNLAETYTARDNLWIAAELPGERYLVCATMTLPKFGCRLDIVDRDLKRLLTLQGDAWKGSPHPTKDGRRLFYLGNTLQVWDTATGKRLASINNPLWAKRTENPFRAYLTPDATQAAILTYRADPKTGPDLNNLTAYLYRLSDSKLLGSFPVKQ